MIGRGGTGVWERNEESQLVSSWSESIRVGRTLTSMVTSVSAYCDVESQS